MVAPTCFGITLPSSENVPNAFWEMLNLGEIATHHVTGHNTPIHDILSTAPQFSISHKALGTLLFVSLALQLSADCGILVSRGFLITHDDEPQWVISSLQRPLYLTTHTTDNHPCLRWDSNPDRSRRAAADLCLRPRGHWDRLFIIIPNTNTRWRQNVVFRC
jgi:hypothetical protein